MLESAFSFSTENILAVWLIKYLVEHLFIQIDVRCFVSKESNALTYMFMNHLFDTIYNL